MRANHIDVARALCIVLVVIGHSELARHFSDANAILTSFRMPMFFIIAGAFFVPGHSLPDTVRRKSAALLKPYLVMAALYAPVYLAGHANATWLDYSFGVLSFSGRSMPGWLTPMWFVTLLWALHVGGKLFVEATRFEHADRSNQICWIIVLLMGGYALLHVMGMPKGPDDVASSPLGLPFNVQLWPLCAFFFLTGYLLSKEIRTWSFGTGTTVVSAMVFCASHALYKPSIDLLEHRYADLLVTTISALSGSLAVIGLARELARFGLVRQALIPLGRLSLYVLMFHAPLLSLTSKALRDLFMMPVDGVRTAVCAVLVSLTASFAAGRFIQGVPAMRLLFEPRHRLGAQTAPVAAPKEETGADLVPDEDAGEPIRLPS